MKIRAQGHRVNPNDELLRCFDVSKRTLNLFSQYDAGGRTVDLEDEIPSATDAIEHVLTRLSGIAYEADLTAVRVLDEPTGDCEQKLLKTARRSRRRAGGSCARGSGR